MAWLASSLGGLSHFHQKIKSQKVFLVWNTLELNLVGVPRALGLGLLSCCLESLVIPPIELEALDPSLNGLDFGLNLSSLLLRGC